jgi:hypothetical protein
VANKFEIRISCQVGEILRLAGNKIVHPHRLVSLGQKLIYQVRAQKAGRAGN